MSWEHARIWTCPHVGHGDKEFESSEGLSDHLSQEHCVASENLASLLEKSAKPATDIPATLAVHFGTRDSPEKRDVCPFCPHESSSSDVLEERNLAAFDPASSEIVSHIAGHLEALSLLSLPRWNEKNDKDLHLRDRSEKNTSMSRSSLSTSHAFEDRKDTGSIDPRGVKKKETSSREHDRSRGMSQFSNTSARPRSRSPLRFLHRRSINPSSILSGPFAARGPTPPIIIEPEAEIDETSPQRSRSPFRRFYRSLDHSSARSSMAIQSQTLATVQDPASVGTLYEVEVIHDWASDLMKVTKDIVKKVGYTEVFNPVNRAARAQKSCSHFVVATGA